MGTALALVFAAILGFLAFVGITIQFIVAMIESYIVVGAGVIFLGFGGSRWTSSYVERYIALAVAVGVKILVLYMLIAGGMQVSEGWADVAAAVASQRDPAMSAWDIAGGALIFLVLCWQAPKLISGLLGGSPTLTGGDLVSTTGAVAVGGLALAGTAAAGVAWASRAIAAGGAAMSVGEAAGITGSSAGGSSSSAGGGGSSVGQAASQSGFGASSSGGEGSPPGLSAPPSAQFSDMSGGLQESSRVSPPAVAAPQEAGSENPEAAIPSPAASQDSGGGTAQSRIGVATARTGNLIAKVSSWTGEHLRHASATTGKAKYVIPNDTPPPAPPPPPVHSQEPD
jgi:type IV secretion system protein TrbL